jgi:hypothetical protein
MRALCVFVSHSPLLAHHHVHVRILLLINGSSAGGKGSNFEGGIRTNAWVSGGLLPAAVRGSRLDGLVALWDWVREIHFQLEIYIIQLLTFPLTSILPSPVWNFCESCWCGSNR